MLAVSCLFRILGGVCLVVLEVGNVTWHEDCKSPLCGKGDWVWDLNSHLTELPPVYYLEVQDVRLLPNMDIKVAPYSHNITKLGFEILFMRFPTSSFVQSLTIHIPICQTLSWLLTMRSEQFDVKIRLAGNLLMVYVNCSFFFIISRVKDYTMLSTFYVCP